MDKIFVMDKSDFAQDKKYFVRADGRGTSYEVLSYAASEIPEVKLFASQNYFISFFIFTH